LRQLAEVLAGQQSAAARRDLLRRQARQLRRRRAGHAAAVSRLKHRRRRLLLESGAENEDEFRQRALRAARAEVLRQERQSLAREIATAVAAHCPEEAIRPQLQGEGASQLPLRREQLHQRLAALEKQLKEQYEHRGQLAAQLKALADDRQLACKQLELATVEKRLQQAIRRWQVLAVTSGILEEIRSTYEQQRQPETLQEASGYLARLTQGRYRRVWTPLGERLLRVDDAEGRSLPVEALSRGTREQLFLSLRLALAACYARRGAPLPLVLDDVLVNFDAQRAKAAAAVLRDFAAAGHQLLVFTCHEHILKLFKALKLPVSRLPDNAEPEHAPINLRQPPAAPSRRGRKADPIPHKTAAKAKHFAADEESPEADDQQFAVESDDEAAEPETVSRQREQKPSRRGKAARSRRPPDIDYFATEDEEDEEDEEDFPQSPDDEVEHDDYHHESYDETEDEQQWEDEPAEAHEDDYEDDESADAA
jgi:hypothetical protein